MKVRVDGDTCTGCGLCGDTCPEVFNADDDMAKVIVEVVPDAAVATCREAVESCPVEAIIIEE